MTTPIAWIRGGDMPDLRGKYKGDVLAAIQHEPGIKHAFLNIEDKTKGTFVPRPPEQQAEIIADACFGLTIAGDDGGDYVMLPELYAQRVLTPIDDRAVRTCIAATCQEVSGRSLGRPALDRAIAALHADAQEAHGEPGSEIHITERRCYDPETRVMTVDTGTLTKMPGDTDPWAKPYSILPYGMEKVPMFSMGNNAFVRGDAFAPLAVDTDAEMPMPVPIEELLRPHLNTPDDLTWHTFLGVLLGAWHPSGGPYHILYLHGASGAAKSQIQDKLVMLTDPRKTRLEKFPKDRDAVFGLATRRTVLAFDNLPATLPDWFQDEVCKLATLYEGKRGGRSYSLRRFVMLNGLYLPAVKPDFRQRMLALKLPEYNHKLKDEVVMARFERARPTIQAALFAIIRYGLAHYASQGDDFESENRLASAEAWLAACEPAIAGQEPGTFSRMLAAHRGERVTREIADSSPDVRALVTFVAAQPGQEWSGTGEALLAALQDVAKANPAIGQVSASAVHLVRGLNRRQREIGDAHHLTWTMYRTAQAKRYIFRLGA